MDAAENQIVVYQPNETVPLGAREIHRIKKSAFESEEKGRR